MNSFLHFDTPSCLLLFFTFFLSNAMFFLFVCI